MAFLDPNQQQGQQQQGQPAPGNGQAPAPGNGQAPAPTGGSVPAPTVSGSGGGDVGAGTSPGVGSAGGQGGWTNIQAYLNANQGDNGSANNLTNSAGSQFNQESQNMQNQANQATTNAQNSVNQSNISNDQANNIIQDAGSNYGYGTTTPNAQYTSDVNKVQGALNGQYQGPSSFSYGLSGQTQNLGNQLTNDQGFQNYMTNLYSQKAGGQLTQGQSDLQNQFDTNNSNLAQARQGLIGQYSGLQQQADNLNATTTNALQGYQNQFLQNQNNLKAYLNGQAGTYYSQINQAEQDAKNAYQNAYQNSPTGYGSALNVPGFTVDPSFTGGVPVSNNMTAAQLQNEQNVINKAYTAPNANGVGEYYYIGHPLAGNTTDQQMYQNAVNNAQGLQNFYNTQEQQYANTAAPQKGDWNAIQDFLGTSNPRQQQNFDVGANQIVGQLPIPGINQVVMK